MWEKEYEPYFMKRILLFFYCVSILFLSGCWDRVEVNDLAIVTAAAIDKRDDNQIELSIQIFIPKSLSSGGGQGWWEWRGENDIVQHPKQEKILQMLCQSFKENFLVKFFGDNVKYLYLGKT